MILLLALPFIAATILVRMCVSAPFGWEDEHGFNLGIGAGFNSHDGDNA